MNLAQTLDIPKGQPFSIDWDITPIYTFTMFESWGGKDGERVRNNDEKFYYFFVDGWESPPSLYLMERGVKHARVMARIEAPQELVSQCVADDGKSFTLDKSHAINRAMREWLKANVVDHTTEGLVVPLTKSINLEEMISGLPTISDDISPVARKKLRSSPGVFTEDEVADLVRQGDFFDIQQNTSGAFAGCLIDNQDELTVTDLASGLMWQRGGCDITNFKKVKGYIEELNARNFAGFSDWRMPTIDEAMSLLTAAVNRKGLHLHRCFSREQPFIFTADQRRPGGYWFADYKQGAVFWASGTIPGGFGRACRTA
ncbi:MAG: DUF1566 domain-containing protein [Proteobacteria bacterium]|nr:DUF1566 domain-containing protein [Pseudomonadota bacterium]MBU1738662.1 DUF1566 domain-containing protein [Pseudomonadota bacterium]